MAHHNCDSSDRDKPEARWADQFNTGYGPHVSELVFYQGTDDGAKDRISTRIITIPDDAKNLFRNLKRHHRQI